MNSTESLAAEYQSFHSGRGWVELTGWSTVTLTGADRATFLHNMCTNNIKRLQAGESCEAFCTDVKGKIVAHVVVIAIADRLILLSVPAQAAQIIAHLDRYIIREDVQLLDETTEYLWLALESTAAVADLDIESAISTTDSSLRFLAIPTAQVDGTREQLSQRDLTVCQASTWHTIRIENNWPLFGEDFDETNLPQEVNRDTLAINFNKGCYLGQETIARIDALGHVNQKLVTVRFSGETVPAAGFELKRDEKVVGRVTSSCWSCRDEAPLALAMVRRGSNEQGTELQSDLGAAQILAND